MSTGKPSKIGNLEDGVVIARSVSKEGPPILEIQKIEGNTKTTTKILYTNPEKKKSE